MMGTWQFKVITKKKKNFGLLLCGTNHKLYLATRTRTRLKLVLVLKHATLTVSRIVFGKRLI